jgi:hypothetical protein
MSEPLGRKTARKTIRDMRAQLTYEKIFEQNEEKKLEIFYNAAEKALSKMKPEYEGLTMQQLLMQIGNYRIYIFRLLKFYDLYCGTLESYITELDDTFDKLLSEAQKMAEEQIKQMPKEKPGFYG